MATRALIGFISTDAAGNQVLTSTYNHYDGYPESLGKGLDKYYSSFEKAREIASMGYISYLDSETGEIEAKNKKPADQTELTDDFIEAMMRVAEQGDSYSADYIYIYDTVNDEWVNVSLMNGIRNAQEKLMIELSGLEYNFMSGGDEVNEDYNTKWQKFLNEFEDMRPLEEDNDKIKDLESQLDFHIQMDNKGRASIIKDKIEKLRKLSNSGDIDGDEFLDKFNPLSKELKSLDEVVNSAKLALKSMPMSDVYIKSLESDVEKNGEGGYEGFENDDWVEDYSEFIVDKLDS